jgi:nucleotide-binding universal stress UspA family protein
MKRVLVAVDGSERAPLVLDAAVELARTIGAELVLMRSVALPAELPPTLFTVSVDNALQSLASDAKRELDALAARVPGELLSAARVRIGGQPWQAIVDSAKEEDVALIVIGSHGYHGLDRLLGTTAAKVVNHADRSVLVVRAPERLTAA